MNHNNINSIRNKIYEIKPLLHEHLVNILAIAETKIHNSFPQDQFHMPIISYIVKSGISTYLTYTLCIMVVILQTRCFQIDNCEPDLSFSKYVELNCFRWLYIYGHICDFLSREYILLQSEQPGDWHQMKTTGPREQD